MSEEDKPDENPEDKPDKKEKKKKAEPIPINPTTPVEDVDDFYSMHIWGGKDKKNRLYRYLYWPLWDMVSGDFKVYQFQKLPRDERIKQVKKVFEWILKRSDYSTMPNLDDVVGREAEINTFVNSIYYHILRDKDALKSKRPPPKVYMIKGESGSGKTFMVNAVIKEAFARAVEEGFLIDRVMVDAGKIASPYMGVMSAAIASIFGSAQVRPTILFIDEANQLGGKGSTQHGDSASKEYVAIESTILQAVDQIKRTAVRTIVIFSSNTVENIREDLRRRCFLVDLDTPGLKRPDMVEVIARELKHAEINLNAEDVMFTLELALRELGQGRVVPGDIQRAFNIVIEDSEKPVRESYRKKVKGGKIADPTPITLESFKRAAKDVRSYKLEKMNEEVKQAEQTLLPRERYEDVGGLSDVKNEVIKDIELSLNPEEAGPDWEPPRGYLFHGPPGTGKTLLTKAIAGENGVPFLLVAGPSLLHGIVGESEKNVRHLFQQARAKAPSIIFMDEIDSIGRARGSIVGGNSGVTESVLNQLLTELDGFNPKGRVVFIGATNRRDILDQGLLDRLDKQFEFGYPKTSEEKLDVIRAQWKGWETKTGIHPHDIFKIFLKKSFSPRACHDMIAEAKRYVKHEQVACRKFMALSDALERPGNDVSPEQLQKTKRVYISDFRRIQDRLIAMGGDFALDVEYRKTAEDNPITLFHLEKALEAKYETEAVKEEKAMQEIHRSKEGLVGQGYGLAVDGVDVNQGTMLVVECVIFPAADLEKGGDVTVYGNIGKGAEESARIGRDILKRINPKISKLDFSVHVVSPGEGGEEVALSGPSAGMVMFQTMLSALIKKPFNPKVVMTGKIDIFGRAGLIGGVHPAHGSGKLDIARESSFEKVVIPTHAYEKLDKDYHDYIAASQEAGTEIVHGVDWREYAKFVFPDLTYEEIIELVKSAVLNGNSRTD